MKLARAKTLEFTFDSTITAADSAMAVTDGVGYIRGTVYQNNNFLFRDKTHLIAINDQVS